MRIGIFGGSFDPIHMGHLSLARCCLQQARLNEVWFTPAAQQPFKPHGPQAPDEDRVAMIRLAITGEQRFAVCELELERGGPSYTADTLRAIDARQPADELFLLMGSDTVRDLPQWHQPHEIVRLATPLVVHRAGEPHLDLEGVRRLMAEVQRCPEDVLQIDMPAIPVSSTEIRQRVATGDSIEGLVPLQVAAYIAEHELYRQNASR